MRSPKLCILSAALLLALGLVGTAQADLVTWDVDPTQSFFRLTIPDQAITIGTTSGTLRVRNANNAAWSDAGGRMARLDGTIASNLVDGATVEFLSGQHNLFALEEREIRPDPASFDPNNTNEDNPNGQYSGTATSLAALGGKVRFSVSIITVDVLYLAITDALFDLDTAGAINLGGGTSIAGSDTQFTLASGLLNVDGLFFSLINDQPVPDTLNEPLALGLETNTAGGAITDVGGLDRQLTLNIAIPFVLSFDGNNINGTAAGTVVAFATIPEPSTMCMGAVGLVSLVGFVVRRRRARKTL